MNTKNNDILLKEIQKIYGEPETKELKNELKKETPMPIEFKNEENDVDDILKHLQQNEKVQQPTEIFELKDENLDQFILNHAGQMVKDSVEYIKELKDHFQLLETEKS